MYVCPKQKQPWKIWWYFQLEELGAASQNGAPNKDAWRSRTLSHKESIKNNIKKKINWKFYLGPKNPKFRNIGRQHVADVFNVNILSETCENVLFPII